MTLREKSIRDGLTIPADQLNPNIMACGHYCKQPGLHELELSARPHRWPEMRKLQKEFFNAIMKQVTEAEEQALEIFGMPDIDTVRNTFKKAASDPFTYNPAQMRSLGSVVDELIEDLVGRGFDPNAVYNHYELRSFAIGTQKTLDDILKNNPEIPENIILANEIVPTLENRYLREVLKSGGDRITTHLATENLPAVKKILRQMARENKTVIDAARALHKKFEGEAWYWLRIARSEAVLASAAAFDAMAEAEKIQYEEWSEAPGACPICSAFGGRTWRRGEGPEPVSDTHPHCGCIRLPLYNALTPVQKPWNRSNPYDRPYSRDEIFGDPSRGLPGLNEQLIRELFT